MSGKRWAVWGLLVLVMAMAGACAPDPYGIQLQAAKIERAVTGASVLEQQEPKPGSADFVLYEGELVRGGGINWKPFYLEGFQLDRAFGEVLMARKIRYAEIFGLLANGIVGEGADGRLVARVPASELTKAQDALIAAENRDRDYIVQYLLAEKGLPPVEAASLARVFGYTRYELLPNGIWAERVPGTWGVKGGSDYERRMMAREPIVVEPPRDAAPQPVIVQPVKPEVLTVTDTTVEPTVVPAAPSAPVTPASAAAPDRATEEEEEEPEGKMPAAVPAPPKPSGMERAVPQGIVEMPPEAPLIINQPVVIIEDVQPTVR